MKDREALLDEALLLIDQEFESLAGQDIEKAEELALLRKKHLESACSGQASTSSAEFQEKLARLQTMQNRLMGEARALHSQLKQDLIRLRGNSRRFSGYREGAKVTPLASKYISRVG